MHRPVRAVIVCFLFPLMLAACSEDPAGSNNGGGDQDAADAAGEDAGEDSEGGSDATDTADLGDADLDAVEDSDSDVDDVSDTADTEQPDTDAQTCTAPQQRCGEECIDTTSSVDHCGGCESPCATRERATAACESSTCEWTCDSGWYDADQDLSNGCECTETNGGAEICDGVDNDCDGEVDESCDVDGDGYCAEGATVESGATCQAGDCDDTDATINPDAAPACDGVDNNCDGDVDNLIPQPGSQQVMTLTGSASASRDYPSPVLATFAGNGFCFAALDDVAGTLALGFLQTNGQTEQIGGGVPTGLNVDLLDIEWDGNACAVLYREGASSLKLQRWTPGSGSRVTLEVAGDLSGEDAWEGVRNAAVWFGTARRCNATTCTPEPSWVVAYVKGVDGTSDQVVFNTVPKAFSATQTLPTPVVIDTSAPVNGDVDVVGPDTSGSGFMVLDKTSLNLTTVREIFEEQATLRDDLSVDDTDVTRGMMNEVDGTHFMQYRRAPTSTRRQTRLSVVTDSGYGLGGFVYSSFDDNYLGRDFVWPIDGVDHFYIDGYSDTVYRTNETGSGTIYYEFIELTHPEFSGFSELLAPGREGGSFWVARLVDDAPYGVSIDAYDCY